MSTTRKRKPRIERKIRIISFKSLHLYIMIFKDNRNLWWFLCSQRWRSSIQSAKTRLGADCGSDHEFLIAKFRLKLKKVGKTTRPFRYDLNQIPYDYTVEVRNRFKGLDLIDKECLMNYGMRFMTLYRRQDQDHPHGKEITIIGPSNSTPRYVST